jgi:hypothetical protein
MNVVYFTLLFVILQFLRIYLEDVENKGLWQMLSLSFALQFA